LCAKEYLQKLIPGFRQDVACPRKPKMQWMLPSRHVYERVWVLKLKGLWLIQKQGSMHKTY